MAESNVGLLSLDAVVKIRLTDGSPECRLDITPARSSPLLKIYQGIGHRIITCKHAAVDRPGQENPGAGLSPATLTFEALNDMGRSGGTIKQKDVIGGQKYKTINSFCRFR